ncbi:MAG: chorismate mutase, partial [Acidobacteria bacterium]|nr:chorismate mutase [Acidobacteriota bacterium]
MGEKDDPRAEIDAIDAELLRLLNKRAEIALEVGAVKRRVGASLCDHKREREVLARLCRQSTGPLDGQSVTNIFQRIIDECLQIQQRAFAPDSTKAEMDARLVREARVAFQGDRGAFSEEAAIELLGETCEPVPRPTFEELF